MLRIEELRISLAGVPIGIRCKYRENRIFLRDYETDEEPLFTIEPCKEDLRQSKADFDRMDREEGNSIRYGTPKHNRSEKFLENNAIHAMIADKLVEHNVLLVHGSALCMDGEGYIFMAASGTGKSTHAELWRRKYGDRVFMINDDKPLIKIEGSSVSVWGTPWDGKHHLSRNTSVPLKAIVDLYRDDCNHIEPMDKADALC